LVTLQLKTTTEPGGNNNAPPWAQIISEQAKPCAHTTEKKTSLSKRRKTNGGTEQCMYRRRANGGGAHPQRVGSAPPMAVRFRQVVVHLSLALQASHAFDPLMLRTCLAPTARWRDVSIRHPGGGALLLVLPPR
ncbi:unnamed protein product, partial [Ectocarpus sp. 4 AP-2014]